MFKKVPLANLYGIFSLLGFSLILIGLVYTPYSSSGQTFRSIALSGPSAEHWLGVDGLGRDFGSRLWKGASHSVGLSLLSCVLSFLIASALVLFEQLRIPILSRGISVLIGLWVGVPVIFMGLILLVFLNPSPMALVLAVSLGVVPFLYRQLRILWIEQRNSVYVRASEVLGAGAWDRFYYTILPNLWPDLRAIVRLLFALCMLELSGLAFLGLIGDPDFPELGSILKQNQAYLYQAPRLLVLPGLSLSLILLWVHLWQSKSD